MMFSNLHTSSKQKPLLSGESESFTKVLMENKDSSIPISSFSNPVPSESSEMASKILQQLDRLALSTEKSPMEWSSSMLRGPPLKSLENVDSSMLLENNVYTSLPDARDSYPQKTDAFQMSAHEDYLELDGDDYFSGTLSAVTSTESSISAGVSPFISSAGGSLGGTSAITGTGSSMFGFSWQAPKNPSLFGSTFSSSPTFGLNSATSLSEANSNNSGSGTTPSVFGSSWQAPTNPSLFGSTVSSTAAPTFKFGAATTSVATNNAPVLGSSSTGASPNSIFPFASTAAATSSQPAFGNASAIVPFGSAASNNNDQISMEDSMAEDTIQSLTPTVPVFGQQSITPVASGSGFGAAAPPSSPYQFSSQQNQANTQNSSLCQASNSLEFNAGGSFSLGSDGGDQSQRRILKVESKHRRSGWNSSIPSAAPPSSPYQFSSLQHLAKTQNSSFYQASNTKKCRVIEREPLFGLTLDVGSFSLGAGGGDKTRRRISKVKSKLRRKLLYCIHTDRKN